jgi:dTMP kinase
MKEKYQFISFEGIEGCGKSTQSKMLLEFFNSQNILSILTREPGGCDISEKIREILINENLQAKTEILLNFAARIEHVENLIKPELENGKIVISDRFSDSTYAYQGYGFGGDIDMITKIHNLTIPNLIPDITFLIDIEVEQAFERIKLRSQNNKYEDLSLDFHKRVRNGFLKLAEKTDRIKIINGNQNPKQVFQDILKILNQN